jgi:hypothetical protein
MIGLPVPAELLVYTAEEWGRLKREARFGRQVAEELVAVYCGSLRGARDEHGG